jgi:hypothetical protein
VKTWWIGILGAGGLCVLLVGCKTASAPVKASDGSDLQAMSARLDVEWERSRGLGLPLRQDELKAHVPADENAALVLAPILKGNRLMPLGKVAADFAEGGPGAAAVKKTLAAFKKDLDLVVATRRSEWEYERDYDRGTAVLYPEYYSVKLLTKGLTFRGLLAAKEGRISEALADFEAARRMAQWTYQEPNLIGLLVTIADETVALRGYEMAAHEWRNDPRALDRLLASLQSIQYKMTLKRALEGEFYIALSTQRNLGKIGENAAGASTFTGEPTRDGKPESVGARGPLAATMDLYNACFEKFNAEGWDTNQAGAWLAKAAADKTRESGLSYIQPSIYFEAFAKLDQPLARRDVGVELTELLIRARIAKARTGTWPEIKGSDPFGGGKPYRSSVEGDSIRIWSLGVDGVDDGGSPTGNKDFVVASPR